MRNLMLIAAAFYLSLMGVTQLLLADIGPVHAQAKPAVVALASR